MRCTALVLAGLAALSFIPRATAAVGNPQIRTDHPIYPGELAYSTPERLARSIIDSGDWGLGLGDSERDMALRLWLWEITHTYHDYCPKCHVPMHAINAEKRGKHEKAHPVRPDPKMASFAADDIDRDMMRWQFSYGYALCGTLHAVIGPKIRAMGEALGKDWRSRRVGIPGDSNHEIYFAGSWRAFDINAMTLLWSSNDPKTAELLPYKAAFGPKDGPNRPELLENAPKFNGKYLPKLTWSPVDKENGKLADWNWMHGILANPEHYWDSDEVGHYNHGGHQSYFSAYTACPVVYALKRGETFTRWFSGDDAKEELGLPKRIWWGSNIKGGPGSVRAWAHYCRDLPEYCVDARPLIFATDSQYNNEYSKRDMREATHGNGLYDWRPNLSAGEWRDGAVRVEGPVRSGTGSPALGASGQASVTFAFFSPYVIAGMPVDDTDPALEGATHGAVLTADAVGEVPVEISVNNGLTFQRVGTLKGTGARIDFTDAVKGRDQYLLRVQLGEKTGLEKMNLRTIVTTCRSMYPKLKAGSTTVTYTADELNGFEASPDFGNKDLATNPASFVAVKDLVWTGYTDDQKVAWKSTRSDGLCIYKVTAPAGKTLQTVSAAACIAWVAPAIKGCRAELAVAASPQGPWQIVGQIDAEKDELVNIHENTTVWVYGQADVSKQDLKTAYVRVRFGGGGKPSGLRYLYLFGTYPVRNAGSLTITHHWTADKQARRHSEKVPAGSRHHQYRIETGKAVRNVKVVLAAGGPG